MTSAILVALALILCARLYAKGRREQVWEGNASKREREAERIVYDRGVWVNVKADGQLETLAEGIARLIRVL